MSVKGILTALGATAILGLATTSVASADPGGAAGNCGPPGQTISEFAKVPGASTVDAFLLPPGQAVSAVCAPGHQAP